MDAQAHPGVRPPPDIPPELLTAFRTGGAMGRRMLDHDWSDSPLGPPDRWPPELAGVVRTMLASRAQIVLFWGPQYAALYNDAYVPTMGVKHPHFLGCPGRDMWSEAWDVIQSLFDGVVATGRAFWSADHPFMLERHGFLEETYFDVSYDPVRLADGTVGGIFCIVSDTTTRVLGGRRVLALSALGSRLADPDTECGLGAQVAAVLGEHAADVPLAALYLDDAGAGGLSLAGVSGVEAARCRPLSGPVGRSLTEVLRTGTAARLPVAQVVDAPPAAAAEQALLLPVTAGTQTVGALVCAPSRYLALDEQYRTFFDLAAAQVSRAVGNLRAYEQERRRAAELAALDQAKTNFFSNVSHEFRTPLTLILGPLEDVLAAPDLLDTYRERLLTMQRNGLRLLKLVNTVLDFSRLESGRLQAAYRPTDLADYTARLAGTFRSAVDRAGLTLVVDTPPLRAPVHVDREMWEKIVLNLLSNAVKFTFEGQIAVRVRADATAAVLQVSDTGVGIPAVELPLLFERFHRVRGARSRSHEGTGIGLALVRELAELHAGAVSVTSEPGRGSTFTVTIPFGRGHLPADRVVEQGSPVVEAVDTRLYVQEARWWVDESMTPMPMPAPAPAAPSRAGAPAGRGRILLADDNADLRDHVAGLLRPYWEVTTVVDGQAAVQAATTDNFDLVLTDVMMPRLDGFGVVKALRGNPETRDLPIVILSARAGEEASVEGLAAGADDYLVKPFSARDLVARVRANLELGQLRRQIIRQLRGLVDAAADIGRVRTTAEVLRVAAGHVRRMTDAGRVVLTVPQARFETDGGADPTAEPVAVLALPDTSGASLGQLRVWTGPGGEPDPAVLFQLARLIGLRLENARIYEAEHRIASTLQHSLLPQTLPQVPGAIVASRYLPGNAEAEVGGDWYDVIAAQDGQLVLVIGDVVGKGVHAAAAMGQLRNGLRAYILEGFDCGEALSRLNRLVDNLGRRQFATVVCVRFDPRTGRLWYSSAGHPAPVVVTPGAGGTFLHDTALGPPIGALAQAVFPTHEARLPAGSRLLLYTDGLVEDRRNGIDLGLAELRTDAAAPAEHLEDLLDTLLAKAADRVRRDDIALLALEAATPRRFTLRLAADPTRLAVLRRRLEAFLTAQRVPDDDVFDLVVAVSEAAANAMEHPVDPAESAITIELNVEPDAVLATVRDTGRWRPGSEGGFRGRGLALIGALTELSVARTDQGTILNLRRPLRPHRG